MEGKSAPQQGRKALKTLEILLEMVLKVPAGDVWIVFALAVIAVLTGAVAVPARWWLTVIDMVMQRDLYLAELVFRGWNHMRWNVDISAHAVPRWMFVLVVTRMVTQGVG